MPHHRRIPPLYVAASILMLACDGHEATAPAEAVPTTEPASTRIVAPGGSIQAAVDAARPGATIVIRPGLYREGVSIDKAGMPAC